MTQNQSQISNPKRKTHPISTPIATPSPTMSSGLCACVRLLIPKRNPNPNPKPCHLCLSKGPPNLNMRFCGNSLFTVLVSFFASTRQIEAMLQQSEQYKPQCIHRVVDGWGKGDWLSGWLCYWLICVSGFYGMTYYCSWTFWHIKIWVYC